MPVKRFGPKEKLRPDWRRDESQLASCLGARARDLKTLSEVDH
jgi:hypothetical protein